MKTRMVSAVSESDGMPIIAMLMQAIAKDVASTGTKPRRAITQASPNVPIVPPTCRMVPTSTAMDVEYPASRTTVGSQLAREYRFSRFMKLTTQSKSVTSVRPSRNKWIIGMPDRCSSRAMNSPSTGAVGAMRFNHRRIALGSRRRTTMNCSDSGSQSSIATPMKRGTTPPK